MRARQPTETPDGYGFGVFSVSSARPERRKRTSKPKVRTGCLTWIRRVKCDEERPNCRRCTSTGRRCDGYASPSNSRALVAAGSIQPKPSQAHVLPNPNPMTITRQLSSDIQGTRLERQYFHRFRVEALKGLALHSENLGVFWERLVPQIAHQDVAVMHALVALGSAYHLQTQGHRSLCGLDNIRLEVFTIRQYNKAIQYLQQQTATQSHERVEITLVCCLIFTCLEFVRKNRDGAVTHIANGLRIIESLPASLFKYFLSETVSDPEGYARRISRLEMSQIFAFFQYFEFSTQVYGAPIRPAMALRQQQALQASALHAEKLRDKFTSLRDCHEASVGYGRYVFARLWETIRHKGDKVFWSSPEQILKHRDIFEYGRQVGQMLNQYMASPTAPRPDTDRLGYLSLGLDHMMFTGAFFIMECMPHNFTRRDMRQYEHKFRDIVSAWEHLIAISEAAPTLDVKSKGGKGGNVDDKPTFTFDNGAIMTMHIMLHLTGDRETRKRAINILRGMGDKCEGIYEARDVLRVYTGAGMTGEGSFEDDLLLDERVGPALTGLGGLPALEAKLAALTIEKNPTNN